MGRLPLKVSGNQFGTVSGKRLFGSIRRKISGSNRTSTEKIVLFFRRKIRVKFHQSHLGYQFQAFAAPVGTPIMAYTRRLRHKGVPFPGFRYITQFRTSEKYGSVE